MTQLIGVGVQDYCLLVADRQITFPHRPPQQQTKLLSFCNRAAIAYTGPSMLDGMPTHDWVAVVLAHTNCQSMPAALTTIQTVAPFAVDKLPFAERRLAFMAVGWGRFPQADLAPYIATVSNMFGSDGKNLNDPLPTFAIDIEHLTAPFPSILRVAGVPLLSTRVDAFGANVERLANRQLVGAGMLRLMVEEILATAAVDSRVSKSALAVCLPRPGSPKPAEPQITVLLNTLPKGELPTFAFFEPGFVSLRQLGPTFVCGPSAFTDFVATTDPARDSQSVSIRPLKAPPEVVATIHASGL
jgi:hypothetical protein